MLQDAARRGKHYSESNADRELNEPISQAKEKNGAPNKGGDYSDQIEILHELSANGHVQHSHCYIEGERGYEDQNRDADDR